jgi:hypothetical protein
MANKSYNLQSLSSYSVVKIEGFSYTYEINASGLKPGGVYDYYANDIKCSERIKPKGKKLGADLIADSSGIAAFELTPVLLFPLIPGGLTKHKLVGPDNVPTAQTLSTQTQPTSFTNSSALQKPSVPANTVSVSVTSDTTATTSRDLGVIRQSTTLDNLSVTPLSEISLYFDYIQTFFIDKTQVAGAATVTLDGVNLYFRQKPNATNNQSQIQNPGVYISICQVTPNASGVLQPNLSKTYISSLVRLPYDQINPSLDAANVTTFKFRTPLELPTNAHYGIIINFEDPQFSLWTATQGQKILNTQTTLGTTYSDGMLFRASNYQEISSDATNGALYKPLSDTDLKFDVSVNYTEQVTVVDPNQPDTQVLNSETIELVNEDYEFLELSNIVAGNALSSIIASSDTDSTFGFIPGEMVYQDFGNTAANVTFYKTGTVQPVNPSSVAITYAQTGLGFDVNTLALKGTGTKFTSEFEINDSIIITDGTAGNTDIRKVVSLKDDTSMLLNEPVSFANAAAYIKKTATAKLESVLLRPNTVILTESNASDKVRFIDDGISLITFTAGSGYANSDYVLISGGTLNATANIVTNASGGITRLNITNTGYGFTTTPSFAVKKSDGSASGGTSAAFTATIGAQLKAVMSNTVAAIANISSLAVHKFVPDFHVNVSGGTISNSSVSFAVLGTRNSDGSVTSGSNYTRTNYNYLPLLENGMNENTNYDAVILSKSLEVLYASTLPYKKSSAITFKISTSNPYQSPSYNGELTSVYAFRTEISSDANTDQTSALTQHYTKKLTFAQGRFAEDLRVTSTMYKPVGTDVKMFARIHNSADEDAFDDKAWTELEVIDSTKLVSSSADNKDYIEVTYGFRGYPPIGNTITGYAYANSNVANTTIVGVGTTSFNTELANGDLIVLYDPLFANTTYAVALVANTPTATAFEINTPIANASLQAATLKIDKVRAGNSQYYAFNNIQNENVVRYYSTSKTPFDNYDTVQILVVPYANSAYTVPKLYDLRVIGVSA